MDVQNPALGVPACSVMKTVAMSRREVPWMVLGRSSGYWCAYWCHCAPSIHWHSQLGMVSAKLAHHTKLRDLTTPPAPIWR